jgi:hypothetical protein
MAVHDSPRTTKLYDHTDDQITLDEVEKIGIKELIPRAEGTENRSSS